MLYNKNNSSSILWNFSDNQRALLFVREGVCLRKQSIHRIWAQNRPWRCILTTKVMGHAEKLKKIRQKNRDLF